MELWLIRHGQTDLNKEKKMQGRSDIPLNETGKAQAAEAARLAEGVHFDAVYSSPLIRAVQTASIISGFSPEDIIKDERLIEADFGKYEQMPYHHMGLRMTLYWALPEIFPAPPTVETIASMVKRSSSFIGMLENRWADQADSHILVSCHGGIIRALKGCLERKPRGIIWRPKPKNCEFRIYSYADGIWNREDHG